MGPDAFVFMAAATILASHRIANDRAFLTAHNFEYVEQACENLGGWRCDDVHCRVQGAGFLAVRTCPLKSRRSLHIATVAAQPEEIKKRSGCMR
jgi:hypothetical protein